MSPPHAGAWIETCQIKALLGAHSPCASPDNYAILFTAAAIIAVPSLVSFCSAEEPPQRVARRRLPMAIELRRGVRLLRGDGNFRQLIIARSPATMMLGLAVPFIVPYSISKPAASAAVGLLMSSKVLTYAISNVFWSRVSDTRGNRRLLLLSAWLGLAAVWMVLIVHLLPESTPRSHRPARHLLAHGLRVPDLRRLRPMQRRAGDRLHRLPAGVDPRAQSGPRTWGSTT